MTDEERTVELTQKAKESYRIYSENNHVDKYEGFQYIDGYCNGYEQGYEDCRHYAHDYYKPKWHDLRKNPNDLPTTEDLHIKIDVVKQWLINKKEFSTLEVIKTLEKENAELKAELKKERQKSIAIQKICFDSCL